MYSYYPCTLTTYVLVYALIVGSCVGRVSEARRVRGQESACERSLAVLQPQHAHDCCITLAYALDLHLLTSLLD